MSFHPSHRAVGVGVLVVAATVLSACGPAQVETAQSPVEGMTRTTETLAGSSGTRTFDAATTVRW